MSAASTPVEKALPRSLPQPLTAICAGLAVIGVVSFLYGLSSDPQTTWLAFHANFIYFATLSQAGMALACIFVLVAGTFTAVVHGDTIAASIDVFPGLRYTISTIDGGTSCGGAASRPPNALRAGSIR